MASTPARFQHVLCPVDFSEYSRTALRYAVALVRRGNGRLTVLYVNDPLLATAAAAAAYDVKALAAKTDAELRRFVAKAIGEDSITPEFVIAFGHAAPEIEKAGERLGADVVVLGSRGLTGPGKWFFGSTTERVLRTTTVPVLVIPRQKRQSATSWARAMKSWPGKRIVVPIDLLDYAVADVRDAIDAVRAFDAKGLVTYVMPPLQFPPWVRLDSRTYDRRRVAAARTELDQLVKTIGGDHESRILIGDTAEEIAACAADVRAGLIVLTLKRALAPLGPQQGAITYRVLSSEVAPILALPQKRRGA